MNHPASSCRTLCIDADAERQQRYMQLLENALDSRITVVCADTGGKGISLCRTFKPHCVLLQVHLPDMTALEFLSALRTGIKASPVAVVVIADDDDEGIAMEAQKWNAQDYVLESTLTAGQLQRAINNAMEIVSLRSRLADAETEISGTGFEDPLTSLATHKLLDDRLTHAVILAKRANHNVGLALFEVNRLKEIFYVHGTEIGNSVLREVARRLQQTMRQSDTTAHMDNNQFAVMMETSATYDGAENAAKKIIEAMREPYASEVGELDISVNVGIALFPNHGEENETPLQHAAAAVTQAKRRNKAYQMFSYDDMTADAGLRRSSTS
jgi:diguanylate cyclase (GGDEF)-like protein